MPEEVATWIEDICSSWDFKRIIPAHLAGPILAGPQDLRCGSSPAPYIPRSTSLVLLSKS